MDIDRDKIHDAVLALLWLNEYATGVAWKGFDWRAMSRLHEKELISNPVRRKKSAYLTEEGAAKGERLFNALFCRRGAESQGL